MVAEDDPLQVAEGDPLQAAEGDPPQLSKPDFKRSMKKRNLTSLTDVDKSFRDFLDAKKEKMASEVKDPLGKKMFLLSLLPEMMRSFRRGVLKLMMTSGTIEVTNYNNLHKEFTRLHNTRHIRPRHIHCKRTPFCNLKQATCHQLQRVNKGMATSQRCYEVPHKLYYNFKII